jgi:hypothetical protein
MNAEFTAIIEPASEGGYLAICLKSQALMGKGKPLAKPRTICGRLLN